MENETISAFAFKTGRMIEDLINKETDNLKDKNMFLEAKILSFRHKLSKGSLDFSLPDLSYSEFLKMFDEHFEIETNTTGKI